MKKRCLIYIALACVLSACQTQTTTVNPTTPPESLKYSFYYPSNSSAYAEEINTFINNGKQAFYTALSDLSIDQNEISNLQLGYISDESGPRWYFSFVYPKGDESYQAYYCIQNDDGWYNTILDHQNQSYDQQRGISYTSPFNNINALLNYDNIDPTTIDQMIITQPLTENDPLIVGINDQQYLLTIDEKTGFECQRLTNIPLVIPQPFE